VLTKGLSVLEAKSILGERTFFGPPRFCAEWLGTTASQRGTSTPPVLRENAEQSSAIQRLATVRTMNLRNPRKHKR